MFNNKQSKPNIMTYTDYKGEKTESSTMTNYKLRAELKTDAAKFILNNIGDIHDIKLIGDELEFKTELPIDIIKDKIRDIVDSHVMLQTIQLIKSYTGIRNYDIF